MENTTKSFALPLLSPFAELCSHLLEVIGSPKLCRQGVGNNARPITVQKPKWINLLPGLLGPDPCSTFLLGRGTAKKLPDKSCFNSIDTFCARTENGSSSASGFCRAGSRHSLMLPDDEKGACERSNRQHLIFPSWKLAHSLTAMELLTTFLDGGLPHLGFPTLLPSLPNLEWSPQ
jgi:hypothetical protein